MSEDFLSRWSRRKREVAKAEQDAAKPPQPDAPAPDQIPEAAAIAEPQPAADEVDLSSLPSLESITEATDISGFLGRGVPEELTRAALRKAWTSDPAIRDFIGPSENAWDFNDPNAIPGFGAIDFSPEQVRQMAAKLVGDVREASEKIERVAATALQQEAGTSGAAEAEIANPVERDTASEQPSDAAAQNKIMSDAPTEAPSRHGGALPR